MSSGRPRAEAGAPAVSLSRAAGMSNRENRPRKPGAGRLWGSRALRSGSLVVEGCILDMPPLLDAPKPEVRESPASTAALCAPHHCTLADAYHPLSVKLLGVCRMLLVDSEPIFKGKTLVLVSYVANGLM